MTQIHTSSDPNVDFSVLGDYFEKHHVDRLMAFVKSLGSRRHQWQVDRGRAVFDAYPKGFELFPEVVRAAHRHGLELIGQFKPFEAFPNYLPHTFPAAPGLAWEDMHGRLMTVPPFVAQHPEYCMRRWPAGTASEPADAGDPVAVIRLVKGDDAPTRIRRSDLELFVSDRLGHWEACDQAFEIEETLEDIPFFPRSRRARVLNLKGLNLPASIRYFEVRLRPDCPETDFVTPLENLLELRDAKGRVIPSTPALKDPPKPLPSPSNPFIKTNRYLQLPEVQRFLAEPAAAEQREAMRSVSPARIGQRHAFHESRQAAVARGKGEVIPILHPIYPEVRRYWLDEIDYLLDCGADGINIRTSSHYHFWCKEPWAFGYNDKVLEQVDMPVNIAEVAEVNGQAFDLMLREAAERVHARGKVLGAHVMVSAFHAQNPEGKLLDFANVNWNWRNWLRESLDFIELRGIGRCYPPMLREIVDAVALECRRAGKSFTLQCDRSIVSRNDPIFEWEQEMAWALKHPGIDNYCLWETGFFSRFGEDGEFHGPPSLKAALERHQLP